IAVADFQNLTGQATFDVVPGLLRTALGQSPELRVTSRERMLDVLRASGEESPEILEEAASRRAAKLAGVDGLIQGRVSNYGDQLAIQISLVDVNRGGIFFTLVEIVSSSKAIPASIDRL